MATSSGKNRHGSVVGFALIIVAVCVMIGGAHSWAVQSGERPVRLRVDTSGNQGVVLGAQSPDDPEPPVGIDGPRELGYEIDTDDAYALWADGLAVFLDARPLDEYEHGHILGARFLDYEHLYESPFPAVVDELLTDPTQPVVFYCTGGECDASHNAAAFFQGLGFTTVHVYLDGYPAWADAGYETDSGTDPFAETD